MPRQWTDEQREEARQKAQERFAGKGSATAVAEPEEQGTDMSALLASLGQALSSAGTKKADQQRALSDLEAVLARLNPKEYPDLVDHPAIQQFVELLGQAKARSSGDPPGTIYNKGTLGAYKKPWTWSDMKDFPTVTFVPMENAFLQWNGLICTVVADMEQTIYKPFHDLYMESRRNTRYAKHMAEWLFRQREDPPPPDFISPEAVRARAYGDGGWYQPGAGSIAGAVTGPAGPESSEGGDDGGEG